MSENDSFNKKYPGIATGFERYVELVNKLDLPKNQQLVDLAQKIKEQTYPLKQLKESYDASISPALKAFATQIEYNKMITSGFRELINNQIMIPKDFSKAFFLNDKLKEITSSINAAYNFSSIIGATTELSELAQKLSTAYTQDIFFQNTSLFLNDLSTALKDVDTSQEEIVLPEETKEVVVEQIKTYLHENKDVLEEIKKEVSENNETLADTKKEIDWKYWIGSVIIPLLGIITTILSLLNPSGPTYNINIENNIQNNQNIENHIQNNVEFIQEISDEQLQEIIDILYEILNSEEQPQNQEE